VSGVEESPSKKKKAATVVPPDVGVLRPPTSTVETLLEDACAHLIKVDPKMRGLIEKHHCKSLFCCRREVVSVDHVRSSL
jgi:DNA-3-methyladenine glycosylase II